MTDKLGTNHYATLEEAFAHQAKVDKLEAALLAMTPAERQEFFEVNGNNIDDLLETMDSD
jgi:hypothetical protein